MNTTARAAGLCLCLGPCKTREQLLQADLSLEQLEQHWPDRLDFPFWAGANDPAALLVQAGAYLRRLRRRSVEVLLASDPAYPARLALLHRAPPCLYFRGRLPSQGMVAMVGSRAASMAGTREARQMAAELVSKDLAVVSGGALGIDAAAHEGALQGGGATVAILGSGLDRIYPQRNTDLFERISRHGALVSPFPMDAAPLRTHFPRRNYLIAAWARAVVVLEAGHRSGALHTARRALAMGIPVLARDTSPGGRRLLRQGAGLATSAEDVLRVLAGQEPTPWRPLPGDPDQEAVLSLLARQRLTVDRAAALLGWSPARAAAALLRLELAGLVESLPGCRFRALSIDTK